MKRTAHIKTVRSYYHRKAFYYTACRFVTKCTKTVKLSSYCSPKKAAANRVQATKISVYIHGPDKFSKILIYF